jgi:predicted lipase
MKEYLAVIDTIIHKGKRAGLLGFKHNYLADAKPLPKQLFLHLEHVAYMGHAISFSPARSVEF